MTELTDAKMTTPSVSIGVPVFNGGPTIEAVLNSLLQQTLQDFEIIISDNCSTDETPVICERLAKKDARIRYIRQSENIGASANFRYVLEKARGEFFRWAAADDIVSADFLKTNYDFLKHHPDYVASVSPARFEGGVFDADRMGDCALTGSPAERILTFFSRWHANARFYSLIRTEVLRECSLVGKTYLGVDWAVSIYLATKGKMNRADAGSLVLGRDGISNSLDIFRAFRSSRIEVLVPMYALSKEVARLTVDFDTVDKRKIRAALIKLNLHALFRQAVLFQLRIVKRVKIGRSTAV